MTDGWRGAVALGLDDLILIPSYYRVYKRVVLSKNNGIMQVRSQSALVVVYLHPSG